MDTIDYIDEIQSHVLGIIVGLMNSYHITPKHVAGRFEYIQTLNSEQISSYYDNELPAHPEPEVAQSVEVEEEPTYVSTRRQFCSAMQKGLRICPRYANCEDVKCKNFHVLAEYICPHVTKGSYCDQEGCELIVIRACRKGKNCNDPECSFRHL